ncbi:aminopeptidase N [mine drainage metagenome]|uniref:Aminopeptidase N n=1 Tax=mine drainage metagenome TaxID=410659 RepID=A0A1J5T063_9ZZZZ
MKKYLMLIGLIAFVAAHAQQETVDTSWKKDYRASATKINDLVHTKLEVKFDFSKSYLYGKAWITLHPHFYPTDTLQLDAKGMNINKVAVFKNGKYTDLKYNYDSSFLSIKLNKTYKATENYVVFIDYTSKPNELKAKGSAAISDAKGLYFINPKGEEKNKPTEIWTQGETESNSAWFPTIDKPNQKCTEEISMTVPSKYVTLSNGKLISQTKNNNGTRTDYWRMDLPHSPYLFFMGVGDYSIVKDSYKGKEVSYYVEKEFAPVARKIFGHTPEMIAFYSRITGVDFPWNKYSQIVGRDYVSGAMENTTSTLHAENAQQDARELIDGNGWEDVIAHELFHQWFGDYVTCESWSNITVNESFADFSETIWNEYKYGKDAGDEVNYRGILSYLSNPENYKKDLVRFYYADKEDVFDQVSYPKGGRILNMLRNYVGDSAFFKSLHLYLTANKFKNGEAHQLRLAFEEVTGQDMNWYWNQWYYGSGHPKLNISYSYDDATKTAKVIVQQTQTGTVFKLPVAIDIYNGANKTRYKVWAQNAVDTFSFAVASKPDLINFDGDKILLCEKKENKTLDNYIHQYKYAGLYVDRREAIDFAAKMQADQKALDLLKLAMKDKYYGLRIYALNKINISVDGVKTQAEPILEEMAKNDAKSTVRAKAIELLGRYKKDAYKNLFEKATYDSSYSIAGSALEAWSKIDSTGAFNAAKELSKKPSKGKLATAISNVLISFGDETSFDFISDEFEKTPISDGKFQQLQSFSALLAKIKDINKLKKGVDQIVKFREAIPAAYRNQTDPFINNFLLKGLATKKEAAGLKEQADYIKSQIPDKK